MANVSAEDVTINTTDGPMRLYTARPDGEPRGAIVVVQEAFGVNPHIEDVTRRTADAGYYAVAPDVFHRSGPGSIVEYGDFGKVMDFFKDVSGDEAILTDIGAAIDHCRTNGFTDQRIGIVGFCFGGRVSFVQAARPELQLAGVIGLYGWPVGEGRGGIPAPADVVEQYTCPVLALFGGADQGITAEARETFAHALEAAGVSHHVVVYDGAPHSFFDRKATEFADASADAWRQVLEFVGAPSGASPAS